MTTIHTTGKIGFGSTALADGYVALHTVGFSVYGTPEYVVTGHADSIDAMATVFMRILKALFPDGTGIVPTTGAFGTWGQYVTYLGDATDRAEDISPDLVEKGRNGASAPLFIQIVLSDEDGLMPWDQGSNSKDQPLLFIPPSATLQ